MLADLIDVTIAANSSKKKPKPYPRPYKLKDNDTSTVSGTKISLEEARELYKIKRREEVVEPTKPTPAKVKQMLENLNTKTKE